MALNGPNQSVEAWRACLITLEQGTDAAALDLLNRFIATYGVEELKLRYRQSSNTIVYAPSQTDIKCTVLLWAGLKKRYQFCKRLLDCGIEVDIGTSCADPEHDKKSPLAMACDNGDIKLVKILLAAGADLLCYTRSGMTVLMYAMSSAEVFNHILQEAQRRNQIAELLKARTSSSKTVFDLAAKDKDAKILALLSKWKIIFKVTSKHQEDFDALKYSIGNKGWEWNIDFFHFIRSNGQDVMTALALTDVVISSTLGVPNSSVTNSACNLIFLEACELGHADVAQFVMGIENYELTGSMPEWLDHARRASLAYPQKFSAFDQICNKIRPKITEKIPAKDFNNILSRLTYEQAYLKLFGSAPCVDVDSKHKAMQRAAAQCAALLDTPKRCVPYLVKLNTGFRQFLQAHKIKIDEPRAYEFKEIDGVNYPVPLQGFVKANKQSALRHYLMQYLNRFGIADKACKWIGFIPHEIADSYISKGYFVTESRFGPGLLHNKYAHMLQYALLALAYDDRQIEKSYYINGTLHTLSFQEVVQSLVMLKDINQDALWADIMDNRHRTCLSLSDPQGLSEMITFYGDQFGIYELRNYLIDSFCAGIRQWTQVHRVQAANESDMTCGKLAEKLDDTNTANFSTPMYLISHAIALERTKKSTMLSEGPKYAVVLKTRPN